jgi:hypothetical protein
MTKVIGVNAIPVTAFCAPASRPLFENYVRSKNKIYFSYQTI